MLFSKEKNTKKGGKHALLQIIEKLEKMNIGDYETLEDIKLEIQEDVPLSDKKRNYLKSQVELLKQISKEQ